MAVEDANNSIVDVDIDINIESRKKNPAWVYLLSLSKGPARHATQCALIRFAHFLGFTGIDDCPWQNLGSAEILAFKDWLNKKGISPNSQKTYLAQLRGLFQKAWELELVNEHELAVFKHNAHTRGYRETKGRSLSYKETAKLFATCKKNNKANGIRDCLIFALGLGCGLRRSEIAGILIKDCHPRQRLSVVGKGNRERQLAPSNQVWEYIEKWLEVRGEEGCANLLTQVDKHGNIRINKPLSVIAIFRIINQRRIDAGVDPFTPHDLRRTYATRLIRNGTDLESVRQLMGHSVISTTTRYIKTSFEERRKFSEALSL